MRPRGLVIAIDGPSGAGKSTAGRELARRLGYTFIDTGAMYRALALKAVREGISLDSEVALARLAKSTEIELWRSYSPGWTAKVSRCARGQPGLWASSAANEHWPP